MLEHQPRTIEQSMTMGMSKQEAWLRELVLVVELDIQSYNSEIEFQAIPLECKSTDKGFLLDPVTTEGYQSNDNGNYELNIYFESQMSELLNFTDGSDLKFDADFDLEGFLKAASEINYEVYYKDLGMTEAEMEREGYTTKISNIINAHLTHTQDTDLKVKVNITEEA